MSHVSYCAIDGTEFSDIDKVRRHDQECYSQYCEMYSPNGDKVFLSDEASILYIHSMKGLVFFHSYCAVHCEDFQVTEPGLWIYLNKWIKLSNSLQELSLSDLNGIIKVVNHLAER